MQLKILYRHTNKEINILSNKKTRASGFDFKTWKTLKCGDFIPCSTLFSREIVEQTDRNEINISNYLNEFLELRTIKQTSQGQLMIYWSTIGRNWR